MVTENKTPTKKIQAIISNKKDKKQGKSKSYTKKTP